MSRLIAALALLVAVAQAFTVQPVAVPRVTMRAAAARMDTEGQVEKFEKVSAPSLCCWGYSAYSPTPSRSLLSSSRARIRVSMDAVYVTCYHPRSTDAPPCAYGALIHVHSLEEELLCPPFIRAECVCPSISAAALILYFVAVEVTRLTGPLPLPLIQGTDFLFFQSPAPETAEQDDLPSVFSGDYIGSFELQGPIQIAVTITGVVSAAAVASVLLA